MAGGIIHARTTSPEFSCATTTHSPMWGTTRNPWNLQASPGGSSGGAGAALAAGFTTLATASDIAGSTRIPAGFTGTVGYKAPYGRIPGFSALAADWYRGDGPMGRTVADTALLASVMSGRHAADHGSWGGNGINPLAGGSVEGLRIGLSLTLGDYPVAPEIRENTLAVARALEAAGATVVPVDLPWTTGRITETIFAHFGHILGPAMAVETAGTEDRLAAYTTRFMADAAAAAKRNTLVESLGMDAALQAELAAAMAGLDALLCPTSAVASLAADGDYLDGIDTCRAPPGPLLGSAHDQPLQRGQPLPGALRAQRHVRRRGAHRGAGRRAPVCRNHRHGLPGGGGRRIAGSVLGQPGARLGGDRRLRVGKGHNGPSFL